MNTIHPRLIAIDLDGTLLNSARQITQESREAIAYAREHGVKILPCSGRHFSGTRSIAYQAGMGDAIICGNGALVSTWQGEVITASMFSPQRCLELLKFCEYYKLGSNLYANDILYTCQANSVTRYYENLNVSLPVHEKCVYCFVPDLAAEVCKNAEKILKLEIFPLPDEPRKVLMQMLTDCSDMAAEGNLRTAVELHAPGVNKATGLAAAARYYGIPMSETIAVGDAENDTAVLAEAGWGAAMGNAEEAARLAADEIIPSCDENGVAWLIHRYVN